MATLEGFWTLDFVQAAKTVGGGVMHVTNGNVFGGDSSLVLKGRCMLTGPTSGKLIISAQYHRKLANVNELFFPGSHTLVLNILNPDTFEAGINGASGQFAIRGRRV